MRLAGTVRPRNLIIAAGACAVIGGAAWRVSTRRPPPVPAALMVSRTPLDVLTYVPAPATTGSRAVSAELPPWFGLPDQPPVTIFAMVVGKRLPRTVHLSLAVPDPAIWPGRDVPVSATGGFDFGPMRRGAYRVSATADDGRCDVALVDTTREPAELPSLILEDCPRVAVTLTRPVPDDRAREVPAAGVVLEDLTGRAVATTDAAGRFEANVHWITGVRVASSSSLHLPGWFAWYANGETYALVPSVTFTGTVVESGGAPVPYVGVQPIWGTFGAMCDDSPDVVTSDAAGRFVFATDEHLCGIRIYRNRDAYEAPLTASVQVDRGPMMLREPEPGSDQWGRNSELSPVVQTYVVDPIEIRARGGGPLELVVRLAHPRRKHGDAFAQLTERPTRR